jgi:hypothetical protein
VSEWVKCPICGESDMQFEREKDDPTLGYIRCTNASCPSNVPITGGPVDADPRALPWRCFHCDQLFFDEAAASAHFGQHEGRTPACQIKSSEGGLVRALREAEEEAERAWSAVHSEGAEGLKAWRAAMTRNARAVESAEQTGYDKGLRDMRKEIETLRRALAWHGDPARMATTREEWQRDVDEAIRWVKDNPEEGRPSFSTWANR